MNKIGIFLFSIALLVIAIVLTVNVTRGVGFFSAIQLTLWLAPVVLLITLASRDYWVGIMLGLCTVGFMFPLPIFDRLHIRVMFGAVLVVLTLAQVALTKDSAREVFRHPAVKMLLFVLAMIILRFLVDRPGSARFRVAGGGGQAYPILMAFLVFPVFIRLGRQEWNVSKNLVIALIMALSSYAIVFFQMLTEGRLIGLYRGPLWIVMPALLAITLHHQAQRPSSKISNLYVASAIVGTLVLSLFTGFRSRLWFALGSILVVMYAYNRFRRAILFIVVTAVIALPISMAIFPRLPVVARRSLSTVLPSRFYEDITTRRQFGEASLSSEYGWDIGWRRMLTDLAIRDISQHPIVGRGWAFTFDQIIAVVGSAEALALAGGYHNGLLQITAAMGIPVGLLFTIAWLWLPFRMLRRARDAPHGPPKIMLATLLGWYISTSGQLLMNGSAPDFFNILVMLGIMMGMDYRFFIQPASEKVDEKVLPSASNAQAPAPIPSIAPAFSRVSR